VITISTEKGLIKVDSWDDIKTRIGFVDNLNPDAHDLDSIIGRYVFGDKVRCGLSNCHTPHTKGYIVATKDGQETNIGKDCGKTYFGVDFELQARQFDRDITEQDNREILWNFTFQLEELEAKIVALRVGVKGADWVYKHSQVLINPSPRVPLEVVRRMSSLAKTKSNILYAQREATKQETEDLEIIQRKKIERPHYIDVQIAKILGIEALYVENDLRKLLVIDLEENIKLFKAENIDNMSYEHLARWKKWSDSVELTFETATIAVSTGSALLDNQNLAPLLKILEKEPEKALFGTFLESIRAAI
jgi:hypothetical protein